MPHNAQEWLVHNLLLFFLVALGRIIWTTKWRDHYSHPKHGYNYSREEIPEIDGGLDKGYCKWHIAWGI